MKMCLDQVTKQEEVRTRSPDGGMAWRGGWRGELRCAVREVLLRIVTTRRMEARTAVSAAKPTRVVVDPDASGDAAPGGE